LNVSIFCSHRTQHGVCLPPIPVRNTIWPCITWLH
jgi:hypothetical protein